MMNDETKLVKEAKTTKQVVVGSPIKKRLGKMRLGEMRLGEMLPSHHGMSRRSYRRPNGIWAKCANAATWNLYSANFDWGFDFWRPSYPFISRKLIPFLAERYFGPHEQLTGGTLGVSTHRFARLPLPLPNPKYGPIYATAVHQKYPITANIGLVIWGEPPAWLWPWMTSGYPCIEDILRFI